MQCGMGDKSKSSVPFYSLFFIFCGYTRFAKRTGPVNMYNKRLFVEAWFRLTYKSKRIVTTSQKK